MAETDWGMAEVGWQALGSDADEVAVVPRVAYFVSAHGFGHAARACAVMEAVRDRASGVHFHIFTQVPEWFFVESLGRGFTYHLAATDVGLVQRSALAEDLGATVDRLDTFYPFESQLLQAWAAWLHRLQVALVVCDIAPLGLVVAREAGLPSVLVENFTWDWIYAGYLADEPRLAPHVRYLEAAFAAAGDRLQAEPVCRLAAAAALTVPPISRPPRTSRDVVRAKLDLPAETRLVLITMGGVQEPVVLPAEAEAWPDVVFVMPGEVEQPVWHGNRLRLPYRSSFYHPDLVQAADVVIGKAGYSTVAEAYQAAVPYGYVPRARFRESEVMARFIRQCMPGQEIPAEGILTGRWASQLRSLLELPRRAAPAANGASQAAGFLLERLA